MKRVKIYGDVVRGMLFIAVVGLYAVAAVADQTNNWWLGGNGNWSNPANWSENKVPDTNHIVRLGYEGDLADVPDTAQNITLDVATADIFRLQFDCEGSRKVTLDGVVGGTTNAVAIYFDGNYVVDMAGTADTDAFVNAIIQVIPSGNMYFNNSSSQLLTFDSNCVFTTTSGFRSNGGPFRFRGLLAKGWRPYTTTSIYFDGGRLSGLTPAVDLMHLKMEGDGFVGTFFPYQDSSSAHGLTIQRVGTGNRTLYITLGIWAASSNPQWDSSDWDAEVLENVAEEGHLTLRTQRWYELSRHFITDSNTTVEVYGASSLMEYGTYPGVVGPGDVRMAMDATDDVFTIRGRALGHTGPTILSTGILSLASYTTTALDVQNAGVTIAEGATFCGTLSPASSLFIASTAALQISATNQVVDGLSGLGAIDLGGQTLTSSDGVSPGPAVGTLPITGSGAFVLSGGASVFDFSADTSVFDRVSFAGDADVTIGGALEVTAPAGFSEYGAGHYTIFDLNGGSISGTFDPIIAPDRMTAELDTSGEDVVLILVRKPTGTAIMVK